MKTLLSGSEKNQKGRDFKKWENEIEKELDQVILDADPVETVALTYDSEHIPVKY